MDNYQSMIGWGLVATAIAAEMVGIFGLSLYSRGKTIANTSAEPAVGALFGIVFLGEHLFVIQWSGLAAIIIASIGATLTARGR